MMPIDEREKADDQSVTGDDASASSTESSGLDERIALVARLLPQMRSLSQTELHTLATNLRVLSNVADARATRSGE